jgi:hypothetical protein
VNLGASLDGSGKSLQHGVRTPDRPARSESLYWLHYPGLLFVIQLIFCTKETDLSYVIKGKGIENNSSKTLKIFG